MDSRFERFSQERKHLFNVSLATLDWYKHSLMWLALLRDVKLVRKRPGMVAAARTVLDLRHR